MSHFSKLWKASIWKSFAGKSSSWVRVSLSSIVGDWKTFERHFWHGVISIAVYMGLSQIEHDRCWSCNFCHAQSLFPTLFLFFFKLGRIWKEKPLNMMDRTKTDIVRFYGLTSAGRIALVTRFSYSKRGHCNWSCKLQCSEWVIQWLTHALDHDLSSLIEFC